MSYALKALMAEMVCRKSPLLILTLVNCLSSFTFTQENVHVLFAAVDYYMLNCCGSGTHRVNLIRIVFFLNLNLKGFAVNLHLLV